MPARYSRRPGPPAAPSPSPAHPHSFTSRNAANEDAGSAGAPDHRVIAAIAFVIVGPAFGLLYWLQQRGKLTETETATELRQAAHLSPAQPDGASADRPGANRLQAHDDAGAGGGDHQGDQGHVLTFAPPRPRA